MTEKQTENQGEEIQKKLNYYFDQAALAKLATGLETATDQQGFLRQYAKKVVEDVLKYVRCPSSTGALLNLDYPTEVKEFRKQTISLVENVEEIREEELEAFQQLARKLTGEIRRLVKEELEEKGVHKKIGAMHAKLGKGGMGTIHECRVGNEEIAMKLMRQVEHKERLDYYKYPELIEATQESEYLMTYYGSLDLDPVDNKAKSNHIDFLEVLPKTAKGLGLFLREKYKETGKRMGSHELLKTIFLPIFNGIKALHDRDIKHLDLKGENVFIRDSGADRIVEVGDYDLARKGEFKYEEGIMGSPAYMSPEHYEREAPITDKTDIYALGMMLFYQFGGSRLDEMWDNIQRSTEGVDCSALKAIPEIKNLIEKCVNLSPDERPDINGLIAETKKIVTQLEEAESAIQKTVEQKSPIERIPMAALEELEKKGGRGTVYIPREEFEAIADTQIRT